MSLWKRMLGRDDAGSKSEPAMRKGKAVRRPREAEELTNVAAEDLFDSALTESIRARWAFWLEIGDMAPDLMVPQVNPIYKNVPAWPSDRLALLTVEREESTIISTDGLSDPFEGVRNGSQGFGVELFMDVAERPLSDLSRTVCVETLLSLAYTIVARGGVDDLRESYGVFSMELPESDLPNTHLTQEGSLCVLLGGPRPDFKPVSTDGPLEEITFLSVTLLTGKEAEIVRQEGASGRADIAQSLLEAGIGHRNVLGRPSIL